MHNPIVFNPAMAGATSCGEFGIDVRKQWTGFPTSPFTQSGFIHGLVGKKHGLGLIIFNDKAGVAGTFGGELAYAFHPISTKRSKLTMGLSVSVEQYTFNEGGFYLTEPSDPIVTYGVDAEIQPDIAFGIFYKFNDFDFGLGARHLLSSVLRGGSIYFQQRHYFLHLTYKKKLMKSFVVEPSILIKSLELPMLSFDYNLKTYINDKFIAGLSYRFQEGLVGMFGVDINNFLICFNYDLVASKLFKYSFGSQEIFIGYKFCRNKNDKKGDSKRTRTAVPCPAYGH